MKKIFFLGIAIFLILIGAWYFYVAYYRENKLMKEGKQLIIKVEEYKDANGRLPNSLSDIGVEERDGMDVLYYFKRDSIHYTVSFPVSAEEHKFYYSDSKKWEEGYREMK